MHLATACLIAGRGVNAAWACQLPTWLVLRLLGVTLTFILALLTGLLTFVLYLGRCWPPFR